MGKTQDSEPIELIPVEVGGRIVYVDPTTIATPVIAGADGRVQIDPTAGNPVYVTELPTERFAGKPNQQQLAQMIQAIESAEAGRPHLPVLATPDGKLRLKDAAGGESVVAQLPDERFASSLATERSEVATLDRSGRHWRHTSDQPGWRSGDPFGWIVELENDFGDGYVFFIESQPNHVYQAQLVRPAQLDLPGHTNHMVQNGIVCLNEHLGHPTLGLMHGALAKWIFYSGCIRRGWQAPYSK